MSDLKIDLQHYEAIDPLALIFPPDIYQKLIEGKYPHVPKTAAIQEATKGLPVDEKKAYLARATNMMVVAKTVAEALSAAK
jgi:hypothetical protein